MTVYRAWRSSWPRWGEATNRRLKGARGKERKDRRRGRPGARRAKNIMTDNETETETETDEIAQPERREFMIAGAAGAAGLVAAQALPGRARAATGSPDTAV